MNLPVVGFVIPGMSLRLSKQFLDALDASKDLQQLVVYMSSDPVDLNFVLHLNETQKELDFPPVTYVSCCKTLTGRMSVQFDNELKLEF